MLTYPALKFVRTPKAMISKNIFNLPYTLKPSWFMINIVAHKRGLKQFNELLIKDANLISGKSTILVENRGE